MAPLLGHGPWVTRCGLTWPIAPWRWTFYDPRPDLYRGKTRPQEWVKLKSEWRHFQALFCYLGPPSHLLWNIRYAYAFVLVVSMGAVIWSGASNRGHLPFELDPGNIFKDSFRLTSFIMAMLLTFRLNRCYDRWTQARVSMASVGTGAMAIFMQAATWIKDDPELLDDFRRWCIVWPYALKMTVEQTSKVLDQPADALLFPEEKAVIYDSRKCRQVVVTKVRALATRAKLDWGQFQSMEQAIMTTHRAQGDAVRIKFQAMPQAVSLICTGFVMIWCCLLPMGLTNDQVVADIRAFIAMAVIAMLLLGVDEVATQLEDPFDLMPLDEIVISYERDINRVMKELQAIEGATRAARERIRLEQAPAIAPCSEGPAALSSPWDVNPTVRWTGLDGMPKATVLLQAQATSDLSGTGTGDPLIPTTIVRSGATVEAVLPEASGGRLSQGQPNF